MRSAMRLMAVGSILGLGLAANAQAVVIIDNTTLGFYNSASGDPTISPIPFEPDLSVASAALGNWLGNPASLNGNWSGPQAIPASWAINSETAIIYSISGYSNVTPSRSPPPWRCSALAWLQSVPVVVARRNPATQARQPPVTVSTNP